MTEIVYLSLPEAIYTCNAFRKPHEICIEPKHPVPVPGTVDQDAYIERMSFSVDSMKEALDWMRDTIILDRLNRGGEEWVPDMYAITQGNPLWAL